MELVDLCKLPQRPSDVLEMREAGVDAWDRLDFDLGCVAFADKWTRELEATVWGPEEPHERQERKKREKWVQKRKRTTAWLMSKLGFAYSGEDEAAVRAKINEELPAIDPKQWEELEWGSAETDE